jgi:hypothetical protein
MAAKLRPAPIITCGAFKLALELLGCQSVESHLGFLPSKKKILSPSQNDGRKLEIKSLGHLQEKKRSGRVTGF